jgi:glycosyltransferase involved in cell wall biosynthesis
MRVALCTNILTPYRLPVLRALAETPGWQLRVFVDAASEFDRSWRVDARGLDVAGSGSLSRVRRGRTLHVPLRLPAALERFRPDVVVSGELGPRTLLAALYGHLAQIPLVVWAYPTPWSPAASGPRVRWRRALLRRASAVIGMGAAARRALVSLGVPDERIFDAPNAHDREGLEKALAVVDEGSARLALAGLGCRERVALVAGRLIPAKGIAELLEAWDLLAPELRDEWTLLFVGSGPLEPDLRRARDSHRRGEIAWLPCLEFAELVSLYAASQLLVFPSLSDPWGLVVNEALASGLPVLCSSRAGCAEDLVRPGRNGWLADPVDTEAFAAALREALAQPDREALARDARETAARFGPERMADGMRRAVTSALAERTR